MTVVTARGSKWGDNLRFQGLFELPFQQQKLASGGYFNRLALVTRKC
jgi:hypothetical protein